MPYDVFVSHSNRDKRVADAVCNMLETEKIRCWIAPRDIPPGAVFEGAIMSGLAACRVMVLIFSASANLSEHVLREVQHAFKKHLIVVPFRLEDVPLKPSLEYYLSSVHWLDALTEPMKLHIQNLVRHVKGHLGVVDSFRAPNLEGVPTIVEADLSGKEGREQKPRTKTRAMEAEGAGTANLLKAFHISPTNAAKTQGESRETERQRKEAEAAIAADAKWEDQQRELAGLKREALELQRIAQGLRKVAVKDEDARRRDEVRSTQQTAAQAAHQTDAKRPEEPKSHVRPEEAGTAGGVAVTAPSLPVGLGVRYVPKIVRNPGRNDPCPCGSGKKFKNCCSNKKGEQASTPAAQQEAKSLKEPEQHGPTLDVRSLGGAFDIDQSLPVAFGFDSVPNVASKPGRNDPCPCGSGKQYKECCKRSTFFG